MSILEQWEEPCLHLETGISRTRKGIPKSPGIDPQKETRQRVTASLEHPIDPTTETGNINDILKNEFAIVFSSLIRSPCLIELDADNRIKTQLFA